MKKVLFGVVFGTLLCSQLALAADIANPRLSPSAASASANGIYLWLDGSSQSVALPKFDLGVERDTATGFSAGPFESYTPRASGYGIVGGIGYRLPHGTIPAAFGSNVRIEFGGSYVDAKASQSGSGAAGGSPGLLWQFVNGLMFVDTGCGVGTCTTSSTLDTHYRSWNVNLKAVSDFRFGNVTLSPSILAFGGETRNNQSFLQNVFTAGFANGFYSANSSLRWTDWGARLGLAATLGLTDTIAITLGGNVGVADRSVSLAASDNCVCALAFIGSSTIGASATTAAFLANAEAGLNVKAAPAVTFRAFGGLNYDSRVPGISAPTHSGAVAVSTFGTPAGIKYEGLTSWYVGGGLIVAFGR